MINIFELKVFLYLIVKFLIDCCPFVTLPLVGLWCLWSTQFTSSLHKLCPFPSQIFIYSSTEMFSSSVMVCLTVGFIRWTCLMPYYILQIFKKNHYCSKQKTNKFLQHYTFLWFIFFFVLRKIVVHLNFRVYIYFLSTA